MRSSILLLLLIVCVASAIPPPLSRFANAPATERFKWKYLDFAYPDEESRLKATETGDYIKENAIPLAITGWKNKIFVTSPRWKLGVPATLSYLLTDESSYDSPKLMPYPNWEENKAGECKLTSVHKVAVDMYDRLWVIDDGKIFENYNLKKISRSCPPTLRIYDLNTDKLLRTYQLRPEDVTEDSLLSNVVVDIGPDGYNDTYAYISDTWANGLITYSLAKNKSNRFVHAHFRSNPKVGYKGLLGLSLSPLDIQGYRTLFFHPIDSFTEFSVSTRVLRSPEMSRRPALEFKSLAIRGPDSRSAFTTMDEDGLMYFTLVDQNAIMCWDSKIPYLPKNFGIIAKHQEVLEYPSDVTLNNGFVWMLSNRLDNILSYGLNTNVYNFRIINVPNEEATRGTVCDKSVAAAVNPHPPSVPMRPPAPMKRPPPSRGMKPKTPGLSIY